MIAYSEVPIAGQTASDIVRKRGLWRRYRHGQDARGQALQLKS